MQYAVAILLSTFVLSTSLSVPSNGRASHSPAKGRLTRTGFASYYARSFDGRLTASGMRLDTDALVAAHPTYPFGTLVRVTNLRNGRAVRVHIVDRGPTRRARRQGIIIDLSRAAARVLGFLRSGRTRVRVEVLRWGR